MLPLVVALLLSQPGPPLSPEAVARFDTERKVLLPALSVKYACEKPGRKAPSPLCDAAQAEAKATAAEIQGRQVLKGLTWAVKRGRSGKVEVSAPWLSALALNKDSVGVWGAVTDITPENAKEKRQLDLHAKEYVALLEGRKKEVTRLAHIDEMLAVWSRTANHLVEARDTAWVFKGTPHTLRKVGERWVLVGAPRNGEGILVSLFVM